MSVAYSLMNRLHHQLWMICSPSYRQVQERLRGIGQPPR